jgi:electron transfer flavoprotein alpha/beta subunit
MLLQRGDVPAVINALDRNAIEQAVAFKEKFGGKVHVITMAPPEAEDQLREALAMGCDAAYLLSDKAFAGGDTLATARVLAAAIKKISGYDMIFCGGYSLDGSTSQVGPQIAEILEIPDLTHAVTVECTAKGLQAECAEAGGHAVYECEYPLLVTFDKEANTPRLPGMVGIMKAAKIEITLWKAIDLSADADSIGLKGSPTQMLNIFTPPVGRKGDILQGTPNEIAAKLLEKLKSEKITFDADAAGRRN